MRSNPVEDPIPGADPTEVQIFLYLTGSARNNGRYDASAVNDPGLPVRALARAIGVPSPDSLPCTLVWLSYMILKSGLAAYRWHRA